MADQGALDLPPTLAALQAELEALRAERDMLHEIMETVAVGVTVQDQAGRLIYANRAAAATMGFSQPDQVLKASLESIHATFMMIDEAGKPLRRETLTSQRILHGEARPLAMMVGFYRPNDDHTGWSSLHSTPRFGPDGAVTGVINMWYDISRLKSLSDDLAAQRELLAVTLEAIGDGVITTDAAGMVSLINPSALALLGLTEDAAIGKHIGSLLVLEDEETGSTLDFGAPGSLMIPPPQMMIALRRSTNSAECYVDMGATPLMGEQEATQGMVLVLADATEQRRQQHRLQHHANQQAFLARASALLATSLDPAETLRMIVELAVDRISDWCAIDLLDDNGELTRLSVHHRDPAKVAEAIAYNQQFPPLSESNTGLYYVMRSGQSLCIPVITEAVLHEAARSPEHLAAMRSLGMGSVLIVPLIARHRALGALTLVRHPDSAPFVPEEELLAQDLGARCALALDTAYLYQEAQQAIQMRDQFLSIAAHELRTPTTTMLGYAQLATRRLARMADADERLLRPVSSIMHQAKRLNRLMLTLLDVSRLQSGALTIELEPLDLATLVERVVEDVRMAVDRHTIVFANDPIPLPIVGDEVRLEQVAYNLIQNAVKYSPTGSTITITLLEEGDKVGFAVADQGIGIPVDAIPRLFKRFFRAANADQVTGFGLGLSIVHEIITRHEGTVIVESHEGMGSCFTVWLPKR